MKHFAKTFLDEKVGQILVLRDSSDDGPEVRFFVQPPSDQLGVCNTAVVFNDTDEGEKAADVLFDNMDLESALSGVGPLLDDLAKLLES